MVNGWMEDGGWMDGWMDGWTDFGRMDEGLTAEVLASQAHEPQRSGETLASVEPCPFLE